MVAIYIAIAALAWPNRFATLLIMYLFDNMRFAFSLATVCIVVFALVKASDAPVRFIVNLVKSRIAWALFTFMFFICGVAAYTTYKVAIPEIVPFYTDQFLADLGPLLHGDYPWKIAHWLLPDALSPVLIFFYSFVWFANWVGMVLFVSFCSDRAAATRYFWSLALTIIVCGTMLATALSSAGPIYYDLLYGGQRYAELMAIVSSHDAFNSVEVYANHLLSAYDAGEPHFGSGISAAPSMHVAIAVLNAFFLSTLGRWPGVAGWAFAAVIMFGSVYTGWHYIVDGYISAVVVMLIWWVTGRMASGPIIYRPTIF